MARLTQAGIGKRSCHTCGCPDSAWAASNESPHAGGQVGLLPTTKCPARTLTNWNGTVFAVNSVPTLN